MTDLQGLIQFWEATLKGAVYLLDPSTKTHIEKTIKYLKELQPHLEELKRPSQKPSAETVG